MQPRRSNLLAVSLAALLAAAGAAAQQADGEPARQADGEAAAAPAQPAAPDAPPSPDAAEPDRQTPDADRGEGQAPPRQERRISLEVTIAPWYPAPGGRYFMPGETRGGRDIDVEDLNIDSPRISPAGRLRLEVDEWSFAVSGAQFRTDRRTISPVTRPIGDLDIMEGDALRTKVRYSTADLMVGNTFFQRSLYAFDYPQSRLGVELEASAGARIDHFDIELEQQGGGRATANEAFLFPLAGIEARIKPTATTLLGFTATMGWNPGLSDQATLASDIIVRAAWQPSARVEVMAGYRITIQRMRSDDGAERFEFNGSHAGLFAGVRIGF